MCLTEDFYPKCRVKCFQIDKISRLKKWVKGFGQITLRRCVVNEDVKAVRCRQHTAKFRSQRKPTPRPGTAWCSGRRPGPESAVDAVLCKAFTLGTSSLLEFV